MLEDADITKQEESQATVHVSRIDLFPPRRAEEEARAITPSTRDGCSINGHAEKVSPAEDDSVSKISDDSVSEVDDRNITKINSLIKIKPTEKAKEKAESFTENSEDSASKEVQEEEEDTMNETKKGRCCRRSRSSRLASVGPVPILSKQMTKDLIKVQSTKFICTKPFDQMNPVEK